MTTVFAQVKLVGPYAEQIEREASEKHVSKPALITHYALKGIESTLAEPEGELRSSERRISATILSMRTEIEALQAQQDTNTAMFDIFVRLFLLHMPEPLWEELEALQSSVLTRYERYLQQVAQMGFDGDRPQALRKIARLLEQRIEVADA
ncbi:hypothetical protein MQE22_08445 [Acidithiobacillus sp. YTS05]|nr:hypothetical protein MQE22_08445 [Acidithiobacillus sp. YTS05]